jgi:hypothetical protein
MAIDALIGDVLLALLFGSVALSNYIAWRAMRRQLEDVQALVSQLDDRLRIVSSELQSINIDVAKIEAWINSRTVIAGVLDLNRP